MSVEIKVPELGESISEATVGTWFKNEGDAVAQDEPLVELETDKVTVEVPCPATGKLSSIAVASGETVEVGALLGMVEAGAAGAAPSAPAAAPAAEAAPAAAAPAGEIKDGAQTSPVVRKMIDEHGLDASLIPGTGKNGRILKEDVEKAIQAGAAAPKPGAAASGGPAGTPMQSAASLEQREQRVKMTRLRQTIARRLKDAQNTAAMLTTYNEIDMSGAMKMRAEYKDLFEKKHGVRLGFMSIFTKAATMALQELPAVNAEIQGDEIVYKNYYNIGVAVGSPKGLVVPVVRDADGMDFFEIEKTIGDFGRRARDGKLGMEEMMGGTFTISNGGVYGSLMSSPILNPPQSGIMGLHKIEKRPVVVNDEIVIRPMMYVALSYDHRIIDGKEAVTFLVRVKELVEDPRRMMLAI